MEGGSLIALPLNRYDLWLIDKKIIGDDKIKAEINIQMDNSAFSGLNGEETIELARILRKLADDIEGEIWPHVDNKKLFDINGNSVGSLNIIEEEE